MNRRLSEPGGDLRPEPASRAAAATLAVLMLIALTAGLSRAQAPGVGAGPAPSSEPYFLKNLHITGFVQNLSGVWIDSRAIEYNHTNGIHRVKGVLGVFPGGVNENSLEGERNLLQVDVNDDLTENDSMFLRSWGLYEPSYPWETNCSGPGTTYVGMLHSQSGASMHCNSDFYNQYGIREFWFKHRAGPLQIFVGKQIVTWGEALAARIGDQINPVDTSWAPLFANLEQSRIPIWMFHPILNLPSFGPLSSNFAELVYIPGFDFLYTQVDYSNDQWDGQNNVAGRVGISGATPGGRWGVRTDSRFLGPFFATFAGAAPFPSASSPPFVLAFTTPGTPVGNVPGGPPFAPLGDTTVVARLPEQTIPRATYGNTQLGFRLHTLLYNTEVTLLYIWNHDYAPVAKIVPDQYICGVAPVVTGNNCVLAPGAPGLIAPFALGRADLFYPQYQAFGVTANRPVYLPGALAQLPFVLRVEALYKNHDAFNTLSIPGTIFMTRNGIAGGCGQPPAPPGFVPGTPKITGIACGSANGITRSDTVLWEVAVDMDSAYTPWLTSTGNLTAGLEATATTILSYSKFMQGAPGYFERAYHNDVQLAFHVTTSWWWGAVSPLWANVYNPDGNTWGFFPNLQLVPPWTNKYFMTLGWIEILGSNKVGLDLGVFKGKSYLYAQFQYNFSLL